MNTKNTLTEETALPLLNKIKETIKKLRPTVDFDDFGCVSNEDEEVIAFATIEKPTWQIDIQPQKDGYEFYFWENDYHVAEIKTDVNGQVLDVIKD